MQIFRSLSPKGPHPPYEEARRLLPKLSSDIDVGSKAKRAAAPASQSCGHPAAAHCASAALFHLAIIGKVRCATDDGGDGDSNKIEAMSTRLVILSWQ